MSPWTSSTTAMLDSSCQQDRIKTRAPMIEEITDKSRYLNGQSDLQISNAKEINTCRMTIVAACNCLPATKIVSNHRKNLLL